METLRCGIVGCGGIARVHAGVLSRQETARLAAFADIDLSRAEAFAGEFGGSAYSSLEEMLDHEALDVLHICTPHYLHVPMAKAAAARGVHVFTEKPPAMDRAQWAEFEKVSGVRVGVCFQNRYNPSVAYLKELLASGRPGAILGARAFVTWHRDAPYYTESGWRGALATEGGGVLINQSIHTLDLLIQFLGRGQVLGASLANRHLRGVIEVEDTLEATLDFGGRTALFYATTAHCTDAPVLIDLVCENASLRLEGEEAAVRWGDGRVERQDFSQAAEAGGKAYWGSSHGRCIGDFYQRVLAGEPFQNDIRGVADTAALMLDIYEQARK